MASDLNFWDVWMSNAMNFKSNLLAESLNSTWGSTSTLGIGGSYFNEASSSATHIDWYYIFHSLLLSSSQLFMSIALVQHVIPLMIFFLFV